MKSRVIGYIRVSTDEQGQSGLGLEAQLSKIRGYCQLYDLDLVAVHQDAASGKSLDRPGLREALKALKTGKATGIIISKLDRLTRSVKDLGLLLETYFDSSYSLFVVQEQVDTRSASGRLVLNLLMSVAQWERETIGERTSDALRAKQARGEKTGGHCPYGYQVDKTGKLHAIESEQAIIMTAVRLRKKGISYSKIAIRLNEKGIKTKTGSSWQAMTIKRILDRVAA